jgi:hypothetical protein
MLLLSIVALCGIVQYPHYHWYYCRLVLPLLFLSAASLIPWKERAVRTSLFVPVLLFYLCFGLLAIIPPRIYLSMFGPGGAQETFGLERASGLIGETEVVSTYENVVHQILLHAGDAPIYAGPDAPELYFLTGHTNPTPNLFEFTAGEDAKPDRILAAIDASGVRTVVVNHGGPFNPSGPPSPALLRGLRGRVSETGMIGRFEIRWKPDN